MPQTTSWTDAKSAKNYPKLINKISADVAIIGGGIAGIFSGYLLAKAGVSVVLLEADRIGAATTMYTTAFLTQDIDTDLSELKKIYGKHKAKMVWESHRSAVDLIESIIKEEGIDCNFMRCPLYIYANAAQEYQLLEDENQTAKNLGFDTVITKKNNLDFPNAGYLKIKNQAKFNPERFLSALAERATELGLQIYEKSEVTKVSGKKALKVEAADGSVIAKNVITATYKPFKNPIQTFAKKGTYDSYVLEAEVPKGIFQEALYLDTENPYHYFRIDDAGKNYRIIIGGEDHRAGFKIPDSKSFTALETYLKKIMAGRKYTITKKWKAPILEPSDGLALIGEYKSNRLVATAFSGNGISYSAISALLLRDIIIGKKNPWRELYDPRRIPSAKQLASKAKDYAEEFIQGACKNLFVKAKPKFKKQK